MKEPILVGLILGLLLNFSGASADDLILEQPLQSATYTSDGSIIARGGCAVNPGVNATFVPAFNVVLKAGFQVKPGGIFTIRNADNDGLSNICEKKYFGHFDFGPDDDPDQDQLTNHEECFLKLNPNSYDIDNDGDGMPDWWEIEFFGLDLGHGRNEDADGDRVANFLQFKLGANPTLKDLPGPGIYYEYDALGRIQKIYRIPSQ